MEMANPLLESFGESPNACVTNSNRPPANLKGKGNPDFHRFVQTQTIRLLMGTFYVLTIWYFRPFGNAGLQSPRDLPSP